MSDERLHLQRYHDRRAHSELSLGPFYFMALVISIWLIVHAVFAERARDAFVAAVSGAAVLSLGLGIRKAAEWARRALVVLFSLGIALNLARCVGAALGRGDASDPWGPLLNTFMGWVFLAELTGTEAKERFARARRFLARRDLAADADTDSEHAQSPPLRN